MAMSSENQAAYSCGQRTEQLLEITFQNLISDCIFSSLFKARFISAQTIYKEISRMNLSGIIFFPWVFLSDCSGIFFFFNISSTFRPVHNFSDQETASCVTIASSFQLAEFRRVSKASNGKSHLTWD